VSVAPPKSAIAEIEVMFGGCGMRRDAAAAAIIVTISITRGFSIVMSSPLAANA
jgi:hypothetical protein